MDTPGDQWKLDEIIARAELEPSIVSVYVEGLNDRAVLQWFFRKKGCNHVTVYEVAVVEVTDQMLKSVQLRGHSNRNKLIGLAEAISTCVTAAKAQNIFCVVDADFDRCLGKYRKNSFLEYTDYTCMEMYFFNESSLRKFVGLVLLNLPILLPKLLENMAKILRRLFLIRLVNVKLNWNMHWIQTLRKYISWDAEHIQFDEKGFLKAYLMKNKRIKDIKAFVCEMGHCEKELHSDPRHSVRGRDFTYLLFLTVKRHKSRRCGSEDLIKGALYGCLELSFIENEPLFIKLASL